MAAYRYCDLWRYNVTTKFWSWIGGSEYSNQISVADTQGEESPLNYPGGRAAHVIFYHSNYIWIFGGNGYTTSGNNFGFLNDLWKFNLNTRLWTWVSGSIEEFFVPSSSTQPGSRERIPAVVTSTSMWFFGGKSGK